MKPELLCCAGALIAFMLSVWAAFHELRPPVEAPEDGSDWREVE